ncbi:TerC/Alx family metal homeostasis membrane protein [Candidatus Nitrososphaera evergladensis]|nr:TerC/Alx family metal homeostasis membrane protein [Candidatus Nitrososphaera evergladensis]
MFEDGYVMWILFGVFVGAALAVDLGILGALRRTVLGRGQTAATSSSPIAEHDNHHPPPSSHHQTGAFRQGLIWTIVWIGLAAIFAVIILIEMGYDKMLEFVTGYAVEKSLSVDNMFVFLLIFSSLGIPHAFQHRVLSAGILSAIAMRIPLIVVGASLLETFHWMVYLFGGMLVLTAARMMLQKKEKKIEVEKNIAVRMLRRILPVSTELHGGKFLARINGTLYATALLVALVIIEVTDLVFAIDSIPAVLAITTDQFLVITSNIFAILGLRSLYFLLAGMMEKFRYLKPALVALLLFIGVKMVLSEVFHIPVVASLAVIAAILGGALVLSVIRAKKEQSSQQLAKSHDLEK